ncbi:hypothetical protein SDC9_55462 [bioreactor metagenome]|uniref:Uncharacterized protein n=1 Tax=bioreactor metagenome TaxID=1076179 RepID=A0A644WZ06_9ZZZZ
MAAAAREFDGKADGGRHTGTCLNRNFACGQFGEEVVAVAAVNRTERTKCIQQPVCSPAALFSALNCEDYAAGPFVLVFKEDFCDGEGYGDVTVMSAGMHSVRIFGFTDPGLLQIAVALGHGQGVTVGPVYDGLTGTSPLHNRNEAAVFHIFCDNAEFCEFSFDVFNGFEFETSRLGDSVQMPADLHGIVFKCVDLLTGIDAVHYLHLLISFE